MPPVGTYEELIASFSKSLRRRFLKEERALADSGLTLTAVPLADNLRRVCQLEAQTASAHGGTPDLGGLVELRTRMLECLGAAIRVPAAVAGGRIVACGIDVTDPDDYYGLVYGCDYSVPERSTAYMCLTFYEPIRYCIARGLGRLRLGFEAFVPKLLRGATVTPRKTWVWTPDRQLLEGLSSCSASSPPGPTPISRNCGRGVGSTTQTPVTPEARYRAQSTSSRQSPRRRVRQWRPCGRREP